MRRLFEICFVLLLAACQTPVPTPAAPPPPPAEPVCPEPPAPPPPPEADELRAVLAYATELRARGTAEPTPAVDVSAAPAALAMRRALLLGQGRSSAELAQAAAQLELVVNATDAQAEPLKALAALLAARLAEQRRLLDSVDRLSQQLRDSQRRNEQLNEKLEALKAIEQTLPVKAGTSR
ncbi:hypothetical protein [Pelomonas sp. Root1444]|uniref:hypothetical protein n=1 Tax=Pelomonas sp. Root1444 TaxID=1736464 RepID=UPI000B21E230|nr:hypothetical protein [Pelomonas sp. Root1444]